jgi:hypothetical protein
MNHHLPLTVGGGPSQLKVFYKASFVKRLRNYHALVIGEVTHQYPIIIRVKELRGINTAGETKFFFQRNQERPLPLEGEVEEVPLR